MACFLELLYTPVRFRLRAAVQFEGAAARRMISESISNHCAHTSIYCITMLYIEMIHPEQYDSIMRDSSARTHQIICCEQ